MQKRLSRQRDELGRFLPQSAPPTEESKSELVVREIKVVKKKDDDHTFLIYTKFLSDGEVDMLIVMGILGVLSIIF